MRKLLSLLVLLASLCSTADARTYKIGMIEWIAYAPLNVAEKEGFWPALGVDVQVINFGSNQELNAALENGRIDIALDMLGSWVGMQQSGVPLVILGETDWSNGGDKIVMKKGFDLSELKGRTIGVYLNQPSVTFFLDRFLKEKGLNYSDVKTVELEPEAMADNFIAGRFDLMVNYDPNATRAVKEGDGIVVATSATYPGIIPEGFVALKENEIPHDDLVNIFRGWYQGVKWTHVDANWTEYAKIINEKTFNGASYSDADLKNMIGSVLVHVPSKGVEYNAADGPVAKYIADLDAFLSASGNLKKPLSASEIFDSAAIVEAAKAEE